MELLFGLFGGFIFGGFVILALLYVLSSLAFVKVFRKLGYQSPGLGWVPILNIFILATIVTTGVSKVKVLGAFELDVNIYRFLWVLPLAVSLLFGGWGTTISYIFAAIYYGDMYSRVYASLMLRIRQFLVLYQESYLSYLLSRHLQQITIWFS